jgi:hypothetical protein
MRFVPSSHSYLPGEVNLGSSRADAYATQLVLTTFQQGRDVGDLYGDAEDVSALEPQPAPASKPDVGQYLDIGISAAKSLFGLDSGERESAAEIQAKIDVARKKLANKALPGAWYWSDQITKLEYRLVAAQELAAEEARAAAISEARNIGYTVLVFLGGAIALGVAVNQFQKARISAAEARRLQKESA